jgi:hypothetical protein
VLYRPYPHNVVCAGRRTRWALCNHDNPSTPYEASYHRWWVPTRGEDEWEGRIWARTSKGVGYGSFNRNPPYGVFLASADLKSAPPIRAARLAAAVLLDANVEFHPWDGYARSHERWSTSSERPSLALLSGCPPRAPTPASHR